MNLKTEIEEKNRLAHTLREKRKSIEEMVVEKLEEEGYNVVDADAISGVVEFNVVFHSTHIDRDMLHNLDEVFESFEYSSVVAEEDDDCSPVLRVYFREI